MRYPSEALDLVTNLHTKCAKYKVQGENCQPDCQKYLSRYPILRVKQLRAAQFPLYTEEDFIKIIYIRLYGQRKNMKYKVEPLEEIQVGGYRFTDFMIRRKS